MAFRSHEALSKFPAVRLLACVLVIKLIVTHSTQLAFVLNQNQHWYTLRRFGTPEYGHWFNLDSAKPSPQWVGKTYLGMFLQQAEQDGQSTILTCTLNCSNNL